MNDARRIRVVALVGGRQYRAQTGTDWLKDLVVAALHSPNLDVAILSIPLTILVIK